MFLLLGVSAVLVRLVTLGQLAPSHYPAWQVPHRPLREAARLCLLSDGPTSSPLTSEETSPAEGGDVNNTELWAHSRFISRSQMKGWSQPDLCWYWKGLGSHPARTRVRDGVQGRNVPAQAARRGMAPCEVAQAAADGCETALITV